MHCTLINHSPQNITAMKMLFVPLHAACCWWGCLLWWDRVRLGQPSPNRWMEPCRTLISHEDAFVALKIAGLSHCSFIFTFSCHIQWLNYQVLLSHMHSESYIRKNTQSCQSTLESKHPAEMRKHFQHTHRHTMVWIVITAHLISSMPSYISQEVSCAQLSTLNPVCLILFSNKRQ